MRPDRSTSSNRDRNPKPESTVADPRARRLASVGGGLVLAVSLTVGVLVGGGGRSFADRNQRPAPESGIALKPAQVGLASLSPEAGSAPLPADEVASVATVALSVPTEASPPTPMSVAADGEVPAAESAPALSDPYLLTGEDTEAEGLAAAEAGRIGLPALIWFHAHWCHVCQEIRPDMEALKGQYASRVAMVTMNVDHPDSQTAASRYQVAGTPTFVLFDANGRVIDRFAGWIGRHAMESSLERAAAVN